jgi:hypothetical protein
MDVVFSWLMLRLQWIYGFVVRDLGLPSIIGYAVIASLALAFFYDLYHIYKNRHKGVIVAVWFGVLLLVPLGSLLYILAGRYMINKVPTPPPRPVSSYPKNVALPSRKVPTTLGTALGIIAWIVGAAAVGFWIFVIVVLIQCANDPKCM